MYELKVTYTAASETDAKRFAEALEQFARGLHIARVVRFATSRVEEYPIWDGSPAVKVELADQTSC